MRNLEGGTLYHKSEPYSIHTKLKQNGKVKSVELDFEVYNPEWGDYDTRSYDAVVLYKFLKEYFNDTEYS